ncbi:type VI secretion system protein TssA [Pseudoduganella sp. FT25W]|uniref:Type VI secretion system protein TssA n=1 Tax=Duganella alba TaxID=2666081 RepID=A0A6L5QCS3_9BURK|nr:type VI secretion system protein TssA [Duganella alba]MRX07545.1 type VI secretion system protein TssA [Duganella alba]MRX15930.1 type VI secretion system protein TssA [Duganella alba]
MFNVAQLLQPVSAEQRCGEDLSFGPEVDAIARARIYDDPTLEQGEWETALKEADWPLVASRCADMIATRSKDLRLAVWLAEALAKTRGLRGLGDGYAVLAGLCELYWTDLYPLVDDGDYDQRIGNLFWLLARTPFLVQECAAAAPELADAEYCLASLIALERVVDTQLGADGPGFSAAREAVQSVVRALAPYGGSVMIAESAQATDGNVVMASAGGLHNRTQALQQLRLVADFFRRTEPHSPVAYLAERAANWGEMPLHVWLRAVIKDPAAIAGVEELLGASPATE